MKPDSDPLNNPRFEGTLKRLREVPLPSPSDGFPDSVMQQIQRETRGSRISFGVRKQVVAVAAMAMLTAGFWWISMQNNNPEQSPVQLLISYQQEDGSWSSQQHPPRARYDTGVTALALLALMHEDSPRPDPGRRAAIQAGMLHLLRQQNADGRFADSSPQLPFTRYLAGMALQRAGDYPDAPEAWRTAALRAAPHLPSPVQMAKLNHQLAHPETFPSRWAEAGGPAMLAALHLLQP